MSLQQQKIQLPGVRTMIGVMSGKGGVGKTFVATTLAITLAKMGHKVGLLDADIGGQGAFKMLGISEKLNFTSDNKITPAKKYGISVVSMAGLCATEDEPISWCGPIMSKIIQQMMKESLWGELDYLILDFPTTITDSSLTLLQSFAIDSILLVTSPQALSLAPTRRTVSMLDMFKIPVLGILENLRGEIFGEGGASRLAEMHRLHLLGSIPLRKQIAAFCDQGIPAIFHMEELEMIFNKITKFLAEKVVV